ncbi:MAG: O-antigen ligase family protein [Bacteroidaceae bacterium]|nr:O-antigen ligase family protein [Bacteroidaceae bacterium]
MGKDFIGKIDLWVAVWFAYYVCNTLAVSHTPCAGVFLHTCGWVSLYMLLRCLPLARIDGRVWAYVCAALGCWQAVTGLAQLFGYSASGHHLYAMTGSFFNPAPFGAFLAVMLSVVTAAYRERHDRMLAAAGCLLLVVLPAAWSRAALLSYAVCLAMLYRTYIIRYRKMVALCAAIAAVSLYLIKQGSANSRVLMLLASFGAWTDNLLLGTGTGGYMHALGESQAAYFAAHPESAFTECVGIADMPFNEPMRIAVEQGLVGLALTAVIMSLAARRLRRVSHPLFYGMVALSVFSLFSYPLSIPAFGVVLAVIVATAADTGHVSTSCVGRACALAGSVALGVAVCAMLLPRREAKDVYGRFAYVDNEVFIKDHYELLPRLDDDRRFLFGFGMLLRRAGRYNDSNAMLSRGAMLSADPMFHILMGRNCEDMQEYGMADSLYAHAFRMVPNRIYPLYRQMKLYENMGDTVRMRSKAAEIADFRVKVESPATREMKREAGKCMPR